MQTCQSRVAVTDPHMNRHARAGDERFADDGVYVGAADARARSRWHGSCIFIVDLLLEASFLVFKYFYVSQGMYLEIDTSKYNNVRVSALQRTDIICEHDPDC